MENPRNCATQWNSSCMGSWMNTCERRRRLRHFATMAPSAFFSGWILYLLKYGIWSSTSHGTHAPK